MSRKIWFIVFLVLLSCHDKNIDAGHTKTNPFAGSQTCRQCHAKEYTDWKGSDHDLAMQKATANSVLADFNHTHFSSKGIDYKFFKKGENFYVHTEDKDGTYKDFKITHTFGVRPLQQYLVEYEKGRKQCLTVAWDVENKTWFDVQPLDSVHYGDWMHWTGGSMTWNNMCADCHSTDLHKNYNPETDTYHTTYSEIDVSCEACHGPARHHVEYYTDYEQNKDKNPPVLYMNTHETSTGLVDKCARCHARRSQLTPYFDYTGNFLDHYYPSLISPPEYEYDGQIKDEDYVYASFVQSKMYHEDVSCKDCHNVHSLKLKKQGNALCLQCHENSYDSPEHHFHPSGSEGAQCINCHMTGRYYMGIDFRRDHSFRIPRPDQSILYGTPNACTGCHKDKSNEWAAQAIDKHYKHKHRQHFSNNLLKGYFENPVAFKQVIQNDSFPQISRATALEQYFNHRLTEQDVQWVIQYLQDQNPLIRHENVLGLSTYARPEINAQVKKLLNDSIRSVRIVAARYFLYNNIPVDTTSLAFKDFWTDLQVNADFASGQHQLALYYQAQGNLEKAKKAYLKALEIDRHYNVSRMNLALLYYRQGKIEEAEKTYLKVIETEPGYSYAYYMLGLLYNEIGKPTQSVQYLEKACMKNPKISRAFYNLALQYQNMQQLDKSKDIINQGLKEFADDENLLYLKLLNELNNKNFQQAEKTCIKLIEINPHNKNYPEILQKIQGQ